MARLRVVLRAVARASSRGSKSLRQVSGNNMFYAGIALMFIGDPAVMGFFIALIAVVLFLPSSGDPMTAVPRDRLELWPLTEWERRALRVLSPLLNPLAWAMLAGMVWKRVTWGLRALVGGAFLAGFIGSSWRMPGVRIPALPAGVLTQLVRKDLRQFLTALDFYCACLLAALVLYLRVTGKLPEDAKVPLTALLIIVMSTLPLTLFGLDGEAGMARYRLLPLAGWKVLVAKGVAYLLLVVLVTLPLSPIGGLAGGLVALAVGQWASVKEVIPQSHWRFRTSRPFGLSAIQILLALFGLGGVVQLGAWGLGLPIAVYAASLWFSGRALSA